MEKNTDNSVELLGYYGSDTIICASAWTSTSRNLSEEKIERIPKLIQTLWSNGHQTPFEKGIVHFLVDTDIATHIQFLKHRISSFNGESARYKELKEDKYYLPEDWLWEPQSKETIDKIKNNWLGKELIDLSWKQTLESYTELGNLLYHQALEDLTPVLGRKRAKESARFFKTYNSKLQGDVMFNMRSFANFLKLRDAADAQLEIHRVAEKMVETVKNIEGNPFEHTLKSFGY